MSVDLIVTVMLVAGAVLYLARAAHKKSQRVFASSGRCGSCSGCAPQSERAKSTADSLIILGNKST